MLSGLCSCSKGCIALALLTLLGALWPASAPAQTSGAIRINTGFLVNSLGHVDDLSSPSAVPLGFTANFFGTPYTAVFVNNNGNLTFNSSLSESTPQSLIGSLLPIIAPFWADVDTRSMDSGVVTYGVDDVDGHNAFGVNYVDVGYFNLHTSPLDSFQVVLIDRSDIGPGDFDMEFNYNSILWETGDLSGGVNGLGGASAVVGYSNGQGISFQLTGSLAPGSFLDTNPNGLIYQTLNSAVPGRLVFPVRNGVSCAYSISPDSQSFDLNGGPGAVSVAAPDGCAWTASSNADFAAIGSISSGADGTGDGTVAYMVAPDSGAARTGTMTIAGQTFTVNQTGSASCSYAVSPQALSFPAGGGGSSVAVTALPGCAWTAASNSSFVTVASGASGAGNGTVGVSAAANSGSALRAGTVSIAGLLLTVVQAGSTPLPALSVNPLGLDVSTSVGSTPTVRAIQISSNNGDAGWTAQWQPFGGPAGWMNVSPTSGTATAAQPSVVNVDFNPSGLTPGIYQGQVTVLDASGEVAGTIAVELDIIPPGAELPLSQASFVFTIQQGGAAPPAQTLQVVNAGQGSMPWGITSPSAPGFPAPSPAGGVAMAGTAGSSIALSVNPAGLSPGVYQNLYQVSAPGAANGMQSVLATLLVVDAGSAPQAEMLPSGLLFIAQQGGAPPPPQTLSLNDSGGGMLDFSVQASTSSGGSWLSVSPAMGNAGPGPATVQVSASPGNLLPGIYRGTIGGSFAQGEQEVEVVLVVAPTGALQAQPGGAAACVPTAMDMLATTIGNGMSLLPAFPQALLAEVVDSCGGQVDDASVAVGVDGLNIVLQAVGNGLYSGIWSPGSPDEESGSVAVLFTAVHPTLGALERSYTVAIAAADGGAALPAVLPGGVVGAAAFPPLRPLAPGSIVAIFGSGLASAPSSALQLPLPISLGGVSVTIGGQDAPLYYADSGQMNAQVPFEETPGQAVSVVVSANGLLAAPQTYMIAPVQPAIFTAGTAGVVYNSQGLISASNPAQAGDVLVIYANGLGMTDPSVETAQPSSAAQVVNPVTVTVGGVDLPVQYQGLTPTLVGLNQVNVQLTGNVPTGAAIPLVISQNGVPSNTILIPVQ